MGLTVVERKAVAKETVAGHRRATKKGKGLIPDELCALAGWTRDNARRALPALSRFVNGLGLRPIRRSVPPRAELADWPMRRTH